MAKNSELGIRMRVEGDKDVKRALESIGNTARNEGDKIARSGDKNARGGRGGGGGVTQDVNVKGGPAIGRLALGAMVGQMMHQGVNAFQSTLAQTFDPNMTDFEKKLKFEQAEAMMVPVTGELGAAKLGAWNQVGLGTRQGLGARINAAFGPAMQGIAQANPGLDEEQLKALIRTQLGGQMADFGSAMKAQEFGPEVGSQVVAQIVDEIMGGSEIKGNAVDATGAGAEAIYEKVMTTLDGALAEVIKAFKKLDKETPEERRQRAYEGSGFLLPGDD